MQNERLEGYKMLKPVTFETLALIKATSPRLQAFYSLDQKFKGDNKIMLLDNILVLSAKVNNQFEYISYLDLEFELKFSRIGISSDLKVKTSSIFGFQLINKYQESISIYIQFPELVKIWIRELSKLLNQIGYEQMYRDIKKLGKGGSASVYEVERISDGKLFAAKIISKSYLDLKEERKNSLINEISLLRALQHDNIMKIQSVFETNTSIYIILERLSGGNLIERFNQNRGFNIQQIATIMRGIIQALVYLHKYDIMHRDIKMENIIFRDETTLQPVIADFGLASFTNDQPYIYYRCGTPGYIAPEIIQMKRNQRIDVACDIFSAGVVFHILLTNRYLFQGQNNEEIYRNNKLLDYNLNSSKYSSINLQALELLRRMLEIDLEQRITASECLQCDFLLEDGDDDEEDCDQKTQTPSTGTAEEQNYLI